MTINLSNGLTGLSLLGGTGTASFAPQVKTETAAVIKAKKAFTMPATTPPWREKQSGAPVSAQLAAIRRLSSIIDRNTDNSLEKLPDIQTSFTTYKALDRLRVIAERAAMSTIPDSERATLQKLFSKGLDDLQTYMAGAKTDLLTLNFGLPSSRSESIGVQPIDALGKFHGEGVGTVRAAPLAGLAGNEIFSIALARGATTQTVTVDLSLTAQPPTLDSVANALNAAIGATPLLDGNGNPVMDAGGNPQSLWQSRFTVEKTGDSWGLVFNAAGTEQASIDQVNSSDALMIASGRTASGGPTSAQIFRIDDPAASLDPSRLNTINALDGKATTRTRQEAAADKSDGSANDANAVVLSPTSAKAIVTDAEGFSYIVGTTAGDLGTSLSDGADDLFLTKVDSEGRVVWQHGLSAAGTGEGAAVSIAPDGSIIVTGTVSGAFSGGDDSQTDMLVARFTSGGAQTFATAIRAIGNESATAVAAGADGSLYVAGRASTGGGDAVIVRLDAAGKIQERRTIDSGAADGISALAIDASGQLLALTREGANTALRRIDSGSLSTDLGSVSLGAVDARAIAVSDDGQIAVAGATATAVNGAQANGMGGGRDAFVTRIAADFSSASTSYIGAADDERADSVAYMDGALYVGGRTNGALEGVRSGTVDAFVARIAMDSGAVKDVAQWGLASSTAEPVKVSAATGGATALGALGLGRGSLSRPVSAVLSTQTALREGDRFSLRVDGGAARPITIGKDETMANLARKIQLVLGRNGTAASALVAGRQVLRITAQSGHSIELAAGPEGTDALGKLGMAPFRLVASLPRQADAPKVTPGGIFSLDLTDALAIGNAKSAGHALARITAALSMTQTAYRSLYWDANKEAMVNGGAAGGGNAYQQARLAQFQAALTRLSVGS